MEKRLSSTQTGIYLECIADPASTHYNLPYLGLFKDKIDVDGLRRALKTAILSHPMLSARLSEKEDGSVVISSGDPVGVTVTELSQKEFDEMKSSLVRPFGLFDGPLARFEIYRTEAGVYLFEDVHHIVFDGTSMALLAASVGAAIDGKQPENEISSAFDEAEKEQTVLSSDEAKHAEKYWDDLLEGVSSICEPESDVRSSETEQRWLKKEIAISEAAFSKMRHKIGFSTSALFTAAFSYALSVFSAASDVAFNTVCSGRDEHNANVVGMFVKTFPFRLKMDQSASVADLLREATAQLSSSRNNSFYPYIRLAEKFCLKPVTEFAYQADRSFNPLVKGLNVEVERIYDKAHIESAALHGEVTRDASGRYVFLLGYHADRYSDDWAKNFADVFDKIVGEFLVKSTLCDVQLIPDGTKALLDGFNKTEVPRDGADIVTMFRRCAKKYKDKPCVVAGDKTYTFFQADALTDALAAELERRGIGRGSVVSVLVPRNEFMAIASLGVLKSGAAYQPLDPSYPEERLRFMTENAHACAIIADRALVGKLGDVTVPVIFTDSVASLPTAGPVDAKISPDDAFVLLYTSGTTGTPKGAIITHSNVSELAKWSHDYFAMDENVRYGAYASYGFDAHLAELYPTLTCGGTLYIVPDDIRLELTAIEEFFNKNEITHSQMTTQVGRQFAMHYKGGKLKDLMVGGEVLVPIEPEKINFKLHNAYGPSECTVLCAIQPVDKLYHRIPIGRPLDNVKVYIVDKNLKLLPPFAPGELLIAGPRVAKGYLGLPEKTAAAFISNPFTDEKGYERAYRSGDVVRMLSDGRLDFIGRNDGQVKVRGFRIELSEVEAVIRQFEGIADATVQAFADEHTGMKYLAAYVVSDRPVDVAALNDFIKSKKPPYMVPSVTMQIDRIPLTANQKVDKRALPLLKRQTAKHVMPETAEEKLAFDCACEALGHSDVGVTDDLYEAGLTSLNVMRLIVLLSDAFGKTVRMSDVRQHPTVRQLAAFASRQASDNDKKTEKLYPLSGVQQGVYVECLANPDTTIYNIPLLLKLDRSTDIDALERALTAVVDAHPYLKARLKTDATGETFVVRDDAKKIKIGRLSFSDLDGGFGSLVRPFDLHKDALTRISIIVDKDDKYLFMDTHHLVFDGESLVVFMRELDAALSGKTPITELYTGFEVAKEEAELKSSPAFGDAKDYFFKLVGDVDAECMPIRDRDDKRLGGQEVFVAAPIDGKALETFLRTSGATVNALWNAAFGFALAKFLARDNCVFTTVYNGRNDPRLLNSVGMFVHTLPVVCNFENGKTGADIVRLVARQLGDSMANDIYPFSEISRDLGVKADILFVYEGKIGTDFVIGGKKAENVRLKTNALKAELSFFVSDADDGFAINCEYDARYYEEWSVRSLVNSVVASFNALVRNERTEDIVLSKPEELARIDKDCFVERAVEDTDVVTLFTRAAKAYPDNTAIIFKDKRISYGELDKLTDRIAAYIQGLGIGKEDVVSILVPRCEYMAEAALGVLKSGAAYQPLDPSYPAERLNFMVKNAKAKLVIADNGLIGLLSDYEGVYLTLDEIGDLPDKKPADPDLSGKNLFIVLYTSGTTGTPKGVMLEHGNLVNFSSWYKDNYSLTPQSVVGAYASFGFDADMMDLYPALTTGACVYIIPEDMRLDLNLLEKSFVENGVTHIFMTTQMGRMFAENMKGESLKHLSVGGETLAPLDPPEGFGLWNGYGPTECTIFTTYQKIEKRYYRNPIGRALDNYKLYVVDKSGHRLPKGALGELWIAGKGVGRGYLDLPEQTKKTFIDNPFDNRAGYERVYRTGDVVRRLEDGTIDFIGRNDGQVKIRGFRIELSEVESVIRDYKGIKDVTVQAFDDKAFGGKFLAAYVVADSPVDFNALSDFIKESKPAYMVPAAFMQLDKIPLNQNQKVNKRALPEPERRADKKTDDLPATELEKEICEEFAKILGLKSVGATDDFFNLGGTSISAAKIVMFAMNKNYPVVYKDVFDNPTARDLARHINDEKGVENVVSRPDDEEITEPALKDNIPRMVDDIAADRPLGRTLLTGATGFLGSHVLKELVENGVETVVLCRGNKDLDAPTRLSAMMAYYFDDPMDEKIGTLIKVVDGDITNADLKEKLDGEHIDTVINCAACVKHFAKDDIIERINVGGAKNVIAVAKEKGARMIQISTLSVAGENVDGKFPPAFRMAENQLYFGQDISNKYVNSKFKAEEAVIRAIDEGLDGKIIRVGNLMGRQSDGEFQINSITNSFIKSLKAYKALGYFPVSACDAATDFSPIDMVAKAVVLLASTPDKFTVFHAANSHEVQMGDVIEAMNRYGFDIKTVPDDVFNEKLAEMMRDDNKKLLASSLLTYSSSDHHVHSFIKSDNTFSIKALYRLGYKWPITDANYLMRVIESLDSLGYFTRTDI